MARLKVFLSILAIAGIAYGIITKNISVINLNFTANSKPIKPAPKPLMYVMGDSLVDDMKAYLPKSFPDWEMVIRGRRGRTIRTWSGVPGYQRAIRDTKILKRTQVAIIGLGVNDERGDDFGDFEREMKNLLAYLKQTMPKGAKIFWLNLYNADKPEHTYNRNATIQRVSTLPGYEFTIIPWHTIVTDHPEWLRDRVHLTKHGNWHMSHEIAQRIAHLVYPASKSGVS